MNCEIQKTLKIDKKLSLWTGCDEGDTYKVICIEQGGTYDYYLQKVSYGDLMHIAGTLEPFELITEYIIQFIELSTDLNFWGD